MRGSSLKVHSVMRASITAKERLTKMGPMRESTMERLTTIRNLRTFD
jgi:hypothetical protein